MIYAYDQWAQMPTKDIYDTQMMAMAINAAKDMYNRGEQEIKDFRKEYGDFYSPIQKDMDWYSKNVTNKIQNTIDGLYSAGIDPIRSAEGRAAVRKAINSIDTGTISKLKESAINASAFNKAKLELQSKGLFNPLLEKYDGPQLSDYSTVDSGVWNRMSPTPYQNMAAFSKDYFDNIKPISRSVSKNGVNYTKREITEQDLHNIANSHFNDLVTTPQGQLMYKMYLDAFDGDSKAARKAFNDSVVSGNMDRLYYEDDYNDNWYKNQNLQISRMNLNIARQNAIARQNGAGRGTLTEDGVSLKEHGYNTALANTMGAGYDRANMDYMSASKNINRIQKEFGKTAGTDMNKFINRYTTSDAIHIEDVKQFHGGKLTDLGFRANMEDVSRLKSVEDVVTNTRGYRGKSTDTSKLLRGVVQKALNNDKYVEVLPQGGTYGAQTKKNQYAVDTPVVVRVYENSDGTGSYKDYKGYWNMGWDSMPAPTSWNDELADIYNMMDNPAGVTSAGRISGRYKSRSLLHNNFDLDDAANVFPYDRDASSDTQATKDRLNAGSSAKNATMYK